MWFLGSKRQVFAKHVPSSSNLFGPLNNCAHILMPTLLLRIFLLYHAFCRFVAVSLILCADSLLAWLPVKLETCTGTFSFTLARYEDTSAPPSVTHR